MGARSAKQKQPHHDKLRRSKQASWQAIFGLLEPGKLDVTLEKKSGLHIELSGSSYGQSDASAASVGWRKLVKQIFRGSET